MTGPAPLGAVTPQGRDRPLDGSHTPAQLPAKLVVPLLKRIDPPFELLVALPLLGRSRADALLQRPLQRVPRPP